jgi:hypothetical protein
MLHSLHGHDGARLMSVMYDLLLSTNIHPDNMVIIHVAFTLVHLLLLFALTNCRFSSLLFVFLFSVYEGIVASLHRSVLGVVVVL